MIMTVLYFSFYVFHTQPIIEVNVDLPAFKNPQLQYLSAFSYAEIGDSYPTDCSVVVRYNVTPNLPMVGVPSAISLPSGGTSFDPGVYVHCTNHQDFKGEVTLGVKNNLKFVCQQYKNASVPVGAVTYYFHVQFAITISGDLSSADLKYLKSQGVTVFRSLKEGIDNNGILPK